MQVQITELEPFTETDNFCDISVKSAPSIAKIRLLMPRDKRARSKSIPKNFQGRFAFKTLPFNYLNDDIDFLNINLNLALSTTTTSSSSVSQFGATSRIHSLHLEMFTNTLCLIVYHKLTHICRL